MFAKSVRYIIHFARRKYEFEPPTRFNSARRAKAQKIYRAMKPGIFKITYVAAFVVVAASYTLQSTPVTQLKVLTFNIWVQGGLSLSNCIEVIRTTGADIVGLQECNATTAHTIASNLDFYVLPGTDCSIVSRYPILSTYAVGSSRAVTVELSPGQRVHLFDCHLTSDPYGPYDLKSGKSFSYITNQEYQIRMVSLIPLLNVMQPFIAGSDPCFLTGDFNAPSHLDYANFAWPTSLACTGAGLGDSYHEVHSTNRTYPPAFAYNEPGITWTPKTYQEPNDVFDRIDFVYYSLGDGVTPISSTELDERNSVNPWPSDHRAVLTTFSITPPTPLDKASLPLPSDLATNITLNPTLYWLPGSNAISHAVYFWAGRPDALLSNTTNAFIALTNLTGSTTYHWRVDEFTPAGTVTGDVWSFTTRSTNAAVYEWDFANGDLSPTQGDGVMAYADGATTSNLTVFGATDGATVPDIAGKSAKYLRAPAFTGTGNGYTVTFTDSVPNGGGAYINQYTMIYDVLLPAPINWFPFFNTNPGNANDADFYVSPDGSLGIAAVGYSTAGTIAANTWYRIAFAADLVADKVTYYVNGTPVYTGGADIDGRYSLYSNFDPGPDLLLFNEGDTSGVYTHEAYLSSFFFTDRTMSDAEILALGGPKARGIMASAQPIELSISLLGTNLLLNWVGGEGPFQLQRTDSLTNTWQDVGSLTNSTSAVIPVDASEGFFRIMGQ